MNRWVSRERDVITRSFSATETRFLRDKVADVKKIVLTRLVECEEQLIEWPFGEAVDIRVTVSQPDDPYLQRLLGAFLRARPRETWGWHECDLWEELITGIDETVANLPVEGRGTVELNLTAAEWFYGALISVGLMYIEQARYGLADAEPDWIDRIRLIFAMVRELAPFVRGESFPNQPESLLKSQPE
ncbi:MAG TPA: DUF2017 family protein [Pseudonocardiaceae bacterium]|jgi:hypothetical protein|nr:DUF2017 family protein [Pseudonocardiaceae bacterium]